MNTLTNILSNLNATSSTISAAVPSGFNFSMDGSGGVNANNISDGGSDMYDGGNFINTNFASNINYSDNVVISSSAFGSGGQFFTRKINNMLVLAADMNSVSTFFIRGNNGADGSGTANATTFSVTVGCITYNVFLKRVFGAGDPSINQMVIIPANPAVSQTFSTNTDLGNHDILGLNLTTRMYYLLYAGSSGLFIDDAQATTIATTFLTQVSATIGTGSCPSPTRTPVTVTIGIPAAPTPVSATPPVICPGNSSIIKATSLGNTINWYTDSVGGSSIGSTASNSGLVVTPSVTTIYYAEAQGSGGCVSATRTPITVQVGISAPTPVTATPPVLCFGATSYLNATSAGNTINWYTDSVGGASIGSSASGSNFIVGPAVTTTYYAESESPATAAGSLTFNYTGVMQDVVIPSGVSTMTVEAFGGQGFSATGGAHTGGLGARMRGTFSVTSGDQIIVLVGGRGMSPSGADGGGGGGTFVVKVNPSSTDVITAGPYSGLHVTPLVIAGGGGGTRTGAAVNGNPGVTTNTATTGSGGSSSGGGAVSSSTPGNGGIVSSSSWGSAGGGFRTAGANDGSFGTGGSSFLAGGAGGIGACSSGSGVYGGFGGGGSGGGCRGGGGGGGYTGGDGGWIAGGGGSFNSGTSQSNTSGARSGDGLVTITWPPIAGCVSATRTPITVTVNTTVSIVTDPTPTTTLTIGNPYSISVVAAGPITGYQWYHGSTLIPGATSPSFSIASTSLSDAGNYTCLVSGPCNTVASHIAVLIITGAPVNDSRCLPINFASTGVFVETALRNLGVTNPDCDTIESNNTTSSTEAGEPLGSAPGSGGYQRTLWYTMSSPTCAATSVRFSTNSDPTDFNTRLTAYHRVSPLVCTGPMVELASIDDDGTGIATASTVLLTPGSGTSGSSTFAPGNPIYVQVSGNTGASGNFGIIVDVDAPDISLGAVTSSSIVVNIPSSVTAYGTVRNVYIRWRQVGAPLSAYSQATLSGSATTYTITGLTSGATYDVWAMYRCSPEDRWVSRKVSGVPTPGCSAPVAAPIITAVGSVCNNVNMSWTTSSLALRYNLRWRRVGSSSYSGITVYSPTSSSNTGPVLLPGTTYEFWVQTICSGGAIFSSPLTTYTTCGAAPRMSDPSTRTEDGVYAYNGIEYHHLSMVDIAAQIAGQGILEGDVNLTEIASTDESSSAVLVEMNEVIDNMSIYPNPAKTEATLSYTLPAESDMMTIKVYDAQGKVMMSEVVSDPSLVGKYTFNLSNYAGGVYFVKVESSNFSETRKLVVDKD